jgi:hypothetical protein
MSFSNIDQMVEEAVYSGIIHSVHPPNKEAYTEGYQAHSDGIPFHMGKYEFFSVKGLSWRIGWNDRALQQRDKE